MWKRLIALLVVSGAAAGTVLLLAPVDKAIEAPLPPDFQRGVSLTGYHREEYASAEATAALRDAGEHGVDWVTITPAWYQPSTRSHRIRPNAERTPSHESVEAIVSYARELGMSVTLKPHLNVLDGTFRGEIVPDDLDAWFFAYGDMIGFYADMARRTGAEQLVIGTELEGVSRHADRWQRLIETIRARYSGRLTYAANYDEVHRIRFWGALDAIGVDAYYTLARRGRPGLRRLIAAWRRPVARLRRLHERFHMDVMLTEVGYPSAESALRTPYEGTGRPDPALQARAVEAAFRVWEKIPWLTGMSWWEWSSEPSEIEENDTGLALNGKPAAEVIRRWYGG